MKRAVNFITLLDLLFIFMLAVAGAVSGTGGDILYYLAFLFPLILTYIYDRLEHPEVELLSLRISKENALASLPLLAPVIGVIFIISYLTSLLLSLFSENTPVDVSGNVFLVIFQHALLPSVLEELLFRYVPLRLLAPYSRKNAVIVSAVCFSLVHCNLYQIPYAFFAGAVFALTALITGSVLPSVVFHFVNNTLSIILVKYMSSATARCIFFSALAAFTLISLTVIYSKREAYAKKFKKLFSSNCKQQLSFSFYFFVFVGLLMAVLNLKI